MSQQKEDILKKNAAEYYSQNKEAIKEKSKNRYKNLSKKEKDRLKSTKEKGISN